MTKSSDIEQKERRALAGSTTTVTTYRDRAIADLGLEAQGRFAKGVEVTGSKPAVVYPRMPEGSPWHSDMVPPEPSLGYAIDAQEAVGEPGEIEASVNAALSPLHGTGENAAEVATEEVIPPQALSVVGVLSSAEGAPAPTAKLVPLAAVGATLQLRRGRKL
jgi:hypothetical protein